MWISREEALEMYARFWVARHGHNAAEAARETAKSLERRGDFDGVAAWNDVANRIERPRPSQEAEISGT